MLTQMRGQKRVVLIYENSDICRGDSKIYDVLSGLAPSATGIDGPLPPKRTGDISVEDVLLD